MTRYDLQSDYPRLVERLRALCAERLSSAAIAERLNAEGFRPPKRADRFTGEMVRRLTVRTWAWPVASGTAAAPGWAATSTGRRAWRGGWGSRRDTVRRWLRAGWLTSRRDADGPPRDLGRRRRAAPAPGTPPAAADLGEQGPPGRIDEAEAPPGAVELSVARLTSSRATPPRSWRALWLEHDHVKGEARNPQQKSQTNDHSEKKETTSQFIHKSGGFNQPASTRIQSGHLNI